MHAKVNLGAALIAATLLGSALRAQTIDSAVLRTNLHPVNVVPVAEGAKGKGWATVWVHREVSKTGEVQRSQIDFQIRYSFDGAIAPTSLRIHRGDPGYNGPMVIESGFQNEEQTPDATGRKGLRRKTYLSGKDASEAVAAILANPDRYYLSVGSATHRDGVMRGQLAKGTVSSAVTLLTGSELVPADNAQKGSALVRWTVVAGRNARNQLVSAEASYEIVYSGFAGNAQAIEWHNGAKGANGPTLLTANLPEDATGSGSVRGVEDLDVGNAQAAGGVTGLGSGPAGYYLALRTSDKPRGAVRGQLRPTATVRLLNTLTPDKLVPAVTLPEASALSAVDLQQLRDNTGAVVAARVGFSLWYRLGENAKLTGLAIHEGPAKQNGLERVSTGVEDTEQSAEGFLTQNVLVTSKDGLAALNALARRPDQYYVTLRTAARPDGVLRSQFGEPSTALPAVTAVSGLSKGAPVSIAGIGGQFLIRGRDLARVQGSTVSIISGNLPTALNGTSVTLSGIACSIVSVAGDAVTAVVPANLNLGRQQSMVVPIVVRTGNGASNVANLTIARSGSLE